MAHENKEGFERRMTVVRNLIRGLGLECADITPLRWNKDQTFPYNNFIYKVSLSSVATAAHFTATSRSRQPCTELPSSGGINTVIVRISNPRALGMNNVNRVENEVAAIHLARDAIARLGPKYANLVPAVFAWKAAADPNPIDETGFGWIVMEYLSGSSLYKQFKTFGMGKKKSIIFEIAAIFSAIQGITLPPGVDRFGGLTINAAGEIVSGQETVQSSPGGPWKEYDDVWRHQLLCQLKGADNSEVIQGWAANGLRERIDNFSRAKLRSIIEKAGVDMSKLCFVHLDFTMSNMLYDPDKQRISGVVDFDWAAITNPAHEFFTSLQDMYGTAKEHESTKLQLAILTGDFSANSDAGEEKHAEAWQLAETWHKSLKERGGLPLSDIPGMEVLDKLNAFIDLLCPWQLGSKEALKQRTTDQNAKIKADAEKAIDDVLCEWGV